MRSCEPKTYFSHKSSLTIWQFIFFQILSVRFLFAIKIFMTLIVTSCLVTHAWPADESDSDDQAKQ